jgi:hypothetical protein
MFCTVGITDRYQRFNIGLKQVRNSVQREMYEWIYCASENGIPIEDVFLVNNFGIKPISTPDEDIAAILGNNKH